jgi:ubiquinone/menaquinone biosynthesis C-methylase UbiE
LPVPASQATVKYVDYKTTEELRQSYPELRNLALVHIDYIGNAEDLSSIPSGSQNFVILNHVFEHLINPIKALSEFDRVLKS